MPEAFGVAFFFVSFIIANLSCETREGNMRIEPAKADGKLGKLVSFGVSLMDLVFYGMWSNTQHAGSVWNFLGKPS